MISNKSSKPWQFDWKRPVWKELPKPPPEALPSLLSGSQVIDHAAALILPSEYCNNRDEEQDDSSLVLTATLVQSSRHQRHQGSRIADSQRAMESADVLQLEVIRYPAILSDHDWLNETQSSSSQDSTHTVQSRVLRWPASVFSAISNALDEEEEEDDDDHDGGREDDTVEERSKPINSWLRLFPLRKNKRIQTSKEQSRHVGLISVCFCRLPPPNPDASSMDVMDILYLLSLGSIGGLSTTQGEWLQERIKQAGETGLQTPPNETVAAHELIIVCMDNQGRIHTYNPFELLVEKETDQTSLAADMDHSMASLLFGGSLLSTLEKTILPLSRPQRTLDLSIPSLAFRNMQQQDPSKHGSDEMAQPLNQESENQMSIWSSDVWDSTIDPATLVFQTYKNVPLCCCYALEYLVIAGKGRKRKFNMKRRYTTSQVGEIVLDGTEVLQQQREKGERSPRVGTTVSAVGRACRGEEESHGHCVSLASTTMTGSSMPKGGFVTFISLQTFSVARTLYLPFVPEHVTPFQWGGMSFLLASGESGAVAIRMDSTSIPTVTKGEAPSFLVSPKASIDEKLNTTRASDNDDRVEIPIRRFQILPIAIPKVGEHFPKVVGSTLTSPPSLSLIWRSQDTSVIVAQRVFSCIDLAPTMDMDSELHLYPITFEGEKMAVIKTEQTTGRTAMLPLRSDSPADSTWCHSGNGWCVVGTPEGIFFVCFEGSQAESGAYIKTIRGQTPEHQYRAFMANILVIDPFKAEVEDTAPLDSALLYNLDSVNLSFSNKENGDGESAFDGILLEAMNSISSMNYRESVAQFSPPLSPRRSSKAYTSTEKSERLLRLCSSWTLLESPIAKTQFDYQMPCFNVRFQNELRETTLLLRKAAIERQSASPFSNILSWLSIGEDYFTAASLALDLLQDSSTLRHLWKAFDKIDDQNERSKLSGLLDGIRPIRNEGSTFTQLSDMTVGCLVKGGLRMSSTLEHFLDSNTFYNASRASLMLVAAGTRAVSEDRDEVKAVMGQGFMAEEFDDKEFDYKNFLWPVRCLLKLGTSRSTLSTVLILLNAAIPDELRRRRRRGSVADSIPSMELCKSLITLILSTTKDAGSILLDLTDEDSHMPYWQSLDFEAKLELSIIHIRDSFPLLREAEVRDWAVLQLHSHLESVAQMGGSPKSSLLPSDWLQRLVVAALANAGCTLESLYSIDCELIMSSPDPMRYGSLVRSLLGALRTLPDRGGIDFNLIIPSLLLLDYRGESWRAEANAVPTQVLLNAICSMAGRRDGGEPLFMLDGTSLMRQCTLVGNVEAGARLIGGRNGLILECCFVLIQEENMDMESAELFLTSESLLEIRSENEESGESPFLIRDCHTRLLWLLEEVVLRVRTYGAFDSSNARGVVDPVLGAKVCLRTWWLLTHRHLNAATTWLTEWLRRELSLYDGSKSPHRLACAALTRALMWPSSREVADQHEHCLATKLQWPNRFLVHLAQSCCGLVEALPPHIAEEAWKRIEGVVVIASQQEMDPSMSFSNGPRINESLDDSFVSATSSLLEIDA